MTMRRLSRLIAWASIAAIVILSLVTPSLRPATRPPHNLAHLATFAIAGFPLGLGYAGRLVHHIARLVVFAGASELAQFVTPGRHPRLIDFVVDAARARAGGAVAALVVRWKPGLSP